MNIKKKLIAVFIFSSILTLLILNVKNPEKTKFYFFTSKIEKISLGNLITITFISGFTRLSSIFATCCDLNERKAVNKVIKIIILIINSSN